MNIQRYVFAVDLDSRARERHFRPSTILDLSSAEIVASSRCATIHVHQDIAYVAAHARCGATLWRIASGSRDGRPQTPWVAYRGMNGAEAAGIAWAWLESRGLI